MHVLRLAKVLAQEKTHWGSYDRLEKEIELASGKVIDRRKLKKLVEGEDVSLRISEFEALDLYLAPKGEGLALKPLFEQPTILEGLGEGNEIIFLIGSFPRPEHSRIDMSRWDIQSMTEFLGAMNRYRGSINFNIENVIYRRPRDIKQGTEEEWHQYLDGEGVSIICIGSPRACRASEVVLARMFGVDPFKATPRAAGLPFSFVWPGDPLTFRSGFALDGKSIQNMNPRLSAAIMKKNSKAMGLVVGDDVKEVYAEGDSWDSYGIVAAQRRPGPKGQVWLAVCGLSGPDTFAAASTVESIVHPLPAVEVGQPAPVLWAVVGSRIRHGDTPGDSREVTEPVVVGEPQLWEPPRR